MMSPYLASSPVVQVHRDLLDQLSRLDQLGEHVAAAHLVAAIDALEERLDGSSSAVRRDRKDDPIEAMARGLVARFEGKAPEAARRQLDAASGQALLMWAAIVGRVDQLLARRSAAS